MFWSNDVGDYGGKLFLLLSNPCINTLLAQKTHHPCNFMQKTAGLDSAQGALSVLFLVCLCCCLHARKREHKAADDDGDDDDGDDDDVDSSQPAQANVSRLLLNENSFWHEQTTAATTTIDGEINGYLVLTKPEMDTINHIDNREQHEWQEGRYRENLFSLIFLHCRGFMGRWILLQPRV